MSGQQAGGTDSRHDATFSPAPPGNRLRFVASDAVGLPVKRKQVQHACLACRQKKKKCNHGLGADIAGGHLRERKRPRLTEGTTGPILLSPISTPNHVRSSAPVDIDEDASTAASHLLGLSDRAGVAVPADLQEEYPQARFVGDINPESIMLEAMAQVSTRSPASHQQRDSTIGVWKEPIQSAIQGNRRSSIRRPLPSSVAVGPRTSPISPANGGDDMANLEGALRIARRNWLDKALADIDPPQTAFNKLRDIYLKKIHPIFPIFDEKRLLNLGTHKVDKAIRLVICLAASTDHESRDHLCLEAYPNALSYPEFSGKVAHLLQVLIQEIDFSNRLLDQIRILAVMALYWQPLEEQDWDGPVRLFSQTMSIVFSIGLHLEVYDKAYHIHDQHDDLPGAQPHRQRCREDIERIFLCIFALDRMIASFYGRPILLNERDFDRDVLKYASMQAPCFRLFILVIWELNQVQDLYRPFAPPHQTAEVSVFERLILDSGAQGAPSSIIATLEVFHHAVSALSVRQSRQAFTDTPVSGLDRQTQYPHLPQPMLNARRSISADRIIQIVKEYDVLPIPFVPYALSISLSVAYRKWRFSQIPMFRARGRAAFMDVLPVLEEWSRVFTSARINYNLAQKVVEGMEKVQDDIKRKCREGTPIRDQLKNAMAGSADQTGLSGNASGGNTNGVIPGPSTIGLAGSGDQPGALPSGNVDSLPSAPADSGASLFDLDFSFPDGLAGLDLFNFFDESTNMDVGEMDSMFDRNLDPMAPAFWPAYPSLDPERIEQGAAFYP